MGLLALVIALLHACVRGTGAARVGTCHVRHAAAPASFHGHASRASADKARQLALAVLPESFTYSIVVHVPISADSDWRSLVTTQMALMKGAGLETEAQQYELVFATDDDSLFAAATELAFNASAIATTSHGGAPSDKGGLDSVLRHSADLGAAPYNQRHLILYVGLAQDLGMLHRQLHVHRDLFDRVARPWNKVVAMFRRTPDADRVVLAADGQGNACGHIFWARASHVRALGNPDPAIGSTAPVSISRGVASDFTRSTAAKTLALCAAREEELADGLDAAKILTACHAADR